MGTTLTRTQKLQLQSGGFLVKENEVPVVSMPKAWFRHKDGRVVELPADKRCLRYYLGKGLVLAEEPKEEAPKPKRKTKKRR